MERSSGSLRRPRAVLVEMWAISEVTAFPSFLASEGLLTLSRSDETKT